jgi:hypothetical protein
VNCLQRAYRSLNMNVLSLNLMTFPCMSQLFTWHLFLEDIEAITDNSGLRDVILILGDFNLPKVKWKVDQESGLMILLNVTSDLKSDLIGGLFDCYLDQINERPNEMSTWLLKVLKHLCLSWTVTTRVTKSKCRSATVNLRL